MSEAICVLGMSRSGTSLTARLLNIAGVYLGPEDDLLNGDLRQLPEEDRAGARAANRAGFWEHYPMMRLNERILRRLGGNWREPPPLLSGWEGAAELDEERQAARVLLADAFGGRRLWGWKDPRNSLTLPFWRQLVPDMRCVICVRHPIDVASSLERRDGMSAEHAIDLWLTYTAHALANSASGPRMFVRYADYFSEPRRSVARLAEFAGCDQRLDDTRVQQLLAGAVDARLRHHHASNEQLLDEAVPSEAISVYLLMEMLARIDSGERGDDMDERLSAQVDGLAARLLGRGG